jgi:hypothetical protein
MKKRRRSQEDLIQTILAGNRRQIEQRLLPLVGFA